MKGKFFSRLIACVLALATISSTFLSPEVKVEAKNPVKEHAKVCKCPYCSLTFKAKAKKFFPEGVKVSKKQLQKVGTVLYRNKKTNNWSVVSKTIKWKKGGKAKVTVKRKDTKKDFSINVDRIMRIYIESSKLLFVEEGKPFPTSDFKKKSTIMVERKHSRPAKFTNYVVKAKKKKSYWAVETSWTSAGKTVKDSISIPILKFPANSKPTASPSAAPTASPSAPPSMTPSVSPSVSPSMTPSANPSTSQSPDSTANPSTSQSPDSTASPSTSQSPDPTANPSTSQSPDSTANPAIPTVKPPVNTSKPTMKPTSSPTSTPEPEKKFYKVTINGGEITRYVGGSIDKEGRFSEGTHLYVKFVPPSGQNFINWTNDKDEVLSYEESYDFYVKGTTTLTANFASTPVKKEPVVHFSGSAYELFPDIQKVRLTMSVEIPEGFEKKEWGILIAPNLLPEEEMVLGKGIFQYVNTKSETLGSADWTCDVEFPLTAWENEEDRYIRIYAKTSVGDIYSSILTVHLGNTSKRRGIAAVCQKNPASYTSIKCLE